MKSRILWLAMTMCLIFATISIAASTIKLKDGRVLVGEIRKGAASYTITLPDGSRQLVPARDVVEIDGKPVGEAASASATESGGDTGGLAFKQAKAKADKADAAIIAVQIWDNFIDKFPDSSDIEAAKKEKEHWDKLYKDNAEKVKGKWIGSDELKKLKEKCDKLYNEAVEPGVEAGVRGVGGMKKLDEILDLYPNHFGANFEKGFYLLTVSTRTRTGSLDSLARGVKALERTTEIAPTVPEVWSNLAIGYNFQRKYQQSIEAAWRAVTMRDDDKELIGTLATAIAQAPRNIVNVNPKIRDINEQAQVIFRKHGGGGGGGWVYLRPKAGTSSDRPPEDKQTAPGVQWSGSGFFVTEDGYLITNHHVAAMDPKAGEVPKGITFRVRMDDGTEVPAKLIALDEKADIAIMKIEPKEPVSFLKIAPGDPAQGAEALVLGYPATGYGDKPSLQISKGTVKSIHPEDEHNVWFDLNTTHGNSGGPIVDKNGNLIAILTAGKNSYNMWIVLGVGVNQINDFVKRIPDKAPKLTIATPSSDETSGLLDSEKITKQCRHATVLVLAVRGAESDETGGAKSDAPKSDADSESDAPSDPGAERTKPDRGGLN